MDGQEIIKRECGKRCAIETCTRKNLEEIPKELCMHLTKSMPKYIRAWVIAHGGGHAKY